MPKLIIYHGGACADGFCSAWLLWQQWPDSEFVAAQYGEMPPNTSGRDVIIVDFSYKRAQMGQILGTANTVVVLDHHKTAEKELDGLLDEMLMVDCDPLNKPYIVFDMTKSGARLTCEYLQKINGYNPAIIPWIVNYVEDRDLWAWKLPNSKEISAAIASYPMTFKAWNAIDGMDQQLLVTEGAAILRMQKQLVDRHVKNAVEAEIGGHKVLCVNATVFQSEIGEALCVDRPLGKEYPFSASFFIRADGFKVYSLRSRGDFDVSVIAKMYGGGGHKNAAGFQLAPNLHTSS